MYIKHIDKNNINNKKNSEEIKEKKKGMDLV